MQTTLRINDHLYREAKAEAARTGVSMTRYIEESLRLRMAKQTATDDGPPVFRVYRAGRPDQRAWEEMMMVAEREQDERDLAKLKPPLP